MESRSPSFLAAAFLLIIPMLLPASARSETPTTAHAPTTASATTQPGISVETHFSPAEEIALTVVRVIDGAQHSVDMAAFSFSHPDITAALVRSHQRGVRVQFLMDYTQSRLATCRANDLLQAGIEVRTRHRRGFQHNKYVIIDESIVLTGSYNFTNSADDRNTENLLVIRNAPGVVRGFADDYRALRAGSLIKG